MSVNETNLPSRWTVKRIEEIFAPLDDGRTLHQGWSPQCEKEASPSEDVWGVLKTTAIQAGEFQPEHNKLLPKALAPRPQTEVKEGDILLTCAGPRVRCGVACLVRQTRKRLMMSGKMYRFRVNPEEHDARYVEAFLQTEQARQAIDKMKTGSSDSGLNLTHERFRQLPIPVAPPDEQRQIVAEIEKQFTRLEAGVAALRRVQANLKRYRAAVLKAACEGRLVPTEAELQKSESRGQKSKAPYETGETLLARILTERRRNWQGRGKYKEPAAPDTANLPEIPDGWTWATTAQLSYLNVGFAFKSAEFEKSGIRLLRGDNLEPGKMRWLDTRYWPESKLDEFRHLLIREGEIVLAMDRPLISSGFKIARARADDLPCLLVQRMARFRPVIETMTSFLFMAMNTYGFIKHLLGGQTGTQLPHISGEGIQSFPVALPPLAEQARIVAEVERRLNVVEELESVVSANLQRATRLRQSILQKAFTGKLT